MSDDLLIASLLVTFGAVCVILLRRVAARQVEARQARLREHLDWVNPAPRKSGRRGITRR